MCPHSIELIVSDRIFFNRLGVGGCNIVGSPWVIEGDHDTHLGVFRDNETSVPGAVSLVLATERLILLDASLP